MEGSEQYRRKLHVHCYRCSRRSASRRCCRKVPRMAEHSLTSIRRAPGVARSAETGDWELRFEVICPDCGDSGGPLEEQSPEVQALRGPFPDAAAARRAAQEHRS